MILIKENKQKRRLVYKLDDGTYKKVWLYKDLNWIEKHVKLLESMMPGYVKDYGFDDNTMWIILKPIPGVPVSNLKHTDKLINDVYKFCIKDLESTWPYVHGDWVLSNILYDDGEFRLCDWDNFDTGYEKSIVLEKLHNDLKSGFGERFDKVIKEYLND